MELGERVCTFWTKKFLFLFFYSLRCSFLTFSSWAIYTFQLTPLKMKIISQEFNSFPYFFFLLYNNAFFLSFLLSFLVYHHFLKTIRKTFRVFFFSLGFRSHVRHVILWSRFPNKAPRIQSQLFHS